MRDHNRGGCFLRLDVVDLESKRFNIFIPKGRGTKGGWASMVETLRRLVCSDRNDKPKERRATLEAKHGEDIRGSDQYVKGDYYSKSAIL